MAEEEEDEEVSRHTQPPPASAAETDLRLRDLLIQPAETLDAEYKCWPSEAEEKERKATVAKALIALTNHGGGYLVFGFDRQSDGTLVASDANRPSDLAWFDPDKINGIVKGWAEPSFHCESRQVAHPETGKFFPVIVVPTGFRTPVRTKKACPCGHVQADVYFIRRPGPESAPPQSGREWDDFIRRCVLAAREDLLDSLRAVLQGGAQPKPTSSPIEKTQERLETWIAESRARFEALVASLPDPDRFRHGVYWIAYALVGVALPPDMDDLRRLIDRAEGGETGWPMWVTYSDPERKPHLVDGCIEAFIGAKPDDPGHSDYWRVSPDGFAYIIRGYFEDSLEPRPYRTATLEAGKFADLTIPIWRIGEALRHARRLALLTESPDATVVFKVGWEGLRGRELISLDTLRAMRAGRISHQNTVTASAIVTAQDIENRLPEIVGSLLKGYYEVFDFFRPPGDLIAPNLTQMLEEARRRGKP